MWLAELNQENIFRISLTLVVIVCFLHNGIQKKIEVSQRYVVQKDCLSWYYLKDSFNSVCKSLHCNELNRIFLVFDD